MKKDKIRLSQCMIVKNEEKNIKKALSWGKGIVYEQIVVDTGSADRTAEVAKEMGAKVFHFTWNDDFSAAKNYAISKAKGNWIAFLDADEWLQEEEAKKLIPILEQIQPLKKIDFVRMKLVNVTEKGTIIGSACQDRIFRKDPKLRYHYRIHEELHHKEKASMGCYDLQDSMVILHSGYGGEDTDPQKGERNARLLKQDLEEEPKDGMRWNYLGDAYEIAGKQQEALECYRKVLREPDMKITHRVTQIHAGLQILKLRINEPILQTREEFQFIKDTLKELGLDGHPDLDFYMGCWNLKAGKVPESAVLFERALQKLSTYHGESLVRLSANLEFPNRVIATAALLEGEPEKAVQFAVSALKLNKYGADSIQILLRAFLTEYKEGASAEPYWKFLCKLYDPQSLKDLLFLHKFSGKSGFEALKNCIWEQLPQSVQQQIEQQG